MVLVRVHCMQLRLSFTDNKSSKPNIWTARLCPKIPSKSKLSQNENQSSISMAFTPGFSRPKGLACQFLGRGSIRICVIVTVSPLSCRVSCRVSCNISLVKDRFSQFTYRKWSTLGRCRWLPGCSKNVNQISQKKAKSLGNTRRALRLPCGHSYLSGIEPNPSLPSSHSLHPCSVRKAPGSDPGIVWSRRSWRFEQGLPRENRTPTPPTPSILGQRSFSPEAKPSLVNIYLYLSLLVSKLCSYISYLSL